MKKFDFPRQKWIGKRLKRKEDVRFLTGQAEFTDDLHFPGMLYAGFVRSPYSHARIKRIDLSKVLETPGVVCSLTGEEAAKLTSPVPNNLREPYSEIEDYCMAVGKARYVGEVVAAVVTEDKYLAEDILDLVEVEYEPLDPVVDPEKAMESASALVHENVPSNVVWQGKYEYGDVEGAFREADLIIKDRLHFHRFTSAPLENSVIIADYQAKRKSLTIWSNNQRPMFNHRFITHALGFPGEKIRYINPDIGGGFGIKNDSYLYMILLVLLAMRAGKPVKWVETRTEHLMASTHGNEVHYDAELAVKKDGTILGLKARAVHDEGAYMRREPIGAINFIRHATVGYTFQNLSMDIFCVATNKCPVGPNRSYGKMQQCFLVERTMDMAARKLGIDPVEMHLKNFVQPKQMPYESPTGCILDGGDYPATLHRALEMIDYQKVREEQEQLRKSGKYIGVGIALGMDGSPVSSSIQRMMNPKAKASGDSEAAWVKIAPDGQIVASVGSSPQGHGHETTVSQVVADVLGVHYDDVYAVPGFDSAVNPYTPQSGTYASRFAIVGVGAVLGAAWQIREKVLRIGAHLLGDVDVEQLDLDDGRVYLKKAKDKSVSLQDIARTAWVDLATLPDDIEAGLFAHYVYRADFKLPQDDYKRGNFSFTYSYAVTAMVVEVDVETGKVKVLKLACVDDAGKRLSPLIVDGQVYGAIGHQLGAALYENLIYDESGQLLTSTFKDYCAPTAFDFPKFELDYLDTPSLATPWGARGVGEGGGSPLIVVSNAVSDALAPFDVEIKSAHVSPEEVLKQLRD